MGVGVVVLGELRPPTLDAHRSDDATLRFLEGDLFHQQPLKNRMLPTACERKSGPQKKKRRRQLPTAQNVEFENYFAPWSIHARTRPTWSGVSGLAGGWLPPGPPGPPGRWP